MSSLCPTLRLYPYNPDSPDNPDNRLGTIYQLAQKFHVQCQSQQKSFVFSPGACAFWKYWRWQSTTYENRYPMRHASGILRRRSCFRSSPWSFGRFQNARSKCLDGSNVPCGSNVRRGWSAWRRGNKCATGAECCATDSPCRWRMPLQHCRDRRDCPIHRFVNRHTRIWRSQKPIVTVLDNTRCVVAVGKTWLTVLDNTRYMVAEVHSAAEAWTIQEGLQSTVPSVAESMVRLPETESRCARPNSVVAGCHLEFVRHSL